MDLRPRRTRRANCRSRHLLSSVMDASTTLAVSGPLLAAVVVAVLAGAVSFASPCVVPLVPGYLAYLAGLVGADAPPATPDEARGPRAGGGGWPGRRRCSSPGSPLVFGAILVGVVWLADALVRNEAAAAARRRRRHDRDGAGVRRADPGPAAGAPGALGAARRGVGRAAARRGVRAGLGAVRRADARRASSPSRRAPAAARCAASCSRWPTARASACRSSSSRSARPGRCARSAGCAGTPAAIQVGGGVLLVAVGLLLVSGLWGGLLARLQMSVAGFTPVI